MTTALLVHASAWGGARDALRPQDATSQTARRELIQQLGYGVVDLERVGSAIARRATLIGAGTLVDGQRHRYEFPLPPALRAVVEWRRLTVTLA